MKNNPDLKVRIVHGNTLTAAVILNEIPEDVTEVFLTGATSKLGRVIALYLCRKGIRVLVISRSRPIMYPRDCVFYLSYPRGINGELGLTTDADAVGGEVPENPEGSAAGAPAQARAGHQIPGRPELQGKNPSPSSKA